MKQPAPPLTPTPSFLLGIQATVGNRAALGLVSGIGPRPKPERPATAYAMPSTPMVMRARLPADAELSSLLGSGANQTPLTAGLRRLLVDAFAELTGPQRAAVHARARGGLSAAALAALPEQERLRRIADAVRDLHPDRALGDPAQYESRLRTGTQRANLRTLLSGTDRLFADILAAPGLSTWITEIFGAGQQDRVRRALRRAKAGLQAAGRRQTITADMSGFSEEASLGGWALFQTHIALEKAAIDDPTAATNIQLALHEAMHFGNGNIHDTIYLEDSTDFTTLATPDKVNNAAHYEVLALRTRAPTNALAFPAPNNVFTPATSTGPTATMTPADEGKRFANQRYRDAWSSSIDLWEEYRRVQQRPRDWIGARRYLPFWSAVQMLTSHQRTISIGGHPDQRPVTLIDLALSENFTRKLHSVWGQLKSTGAAALETAHASAGELAAATTADDHRDLLVKCALRAAGISLTVGVDRDAEVVRLLDVNAGRLFQARDPATAPPP